MSLMWFILNACGWTWPVSIMPYKNKTSCCQVCKHEGLQKQWCTGVDWGPGQLRRKGWRKTPLEWRSFFQLTAKEFFSSSAGKVCKSFVGFEYSPNIAQGNWSMQLPSKNAPCSPASRERWKRWHIPVASGWYAVMQWTWPEIWPQVRNKLSTQPTIPWNLCAGQVKRIYNRPVLL